MSIRDSTVIITGASRGIGAAAARAFASAGARVALIARSRARIDDLAEEIGEAALPISCDVSDYGQMQAAINETVRHFSTPTILINNAGVIEPIARLENSDPAGWAGAVEINLMGAYNAARAVLPLMKEAGGGSMLMLSSGAAHGPVEGWSHYCASKAGVAMLTRCIDKEERENGIRAIGLSPGTVATQMQREIKASGINPVSKLDWADHIPPEWVARALLWMCTSDADEFLGGEVALREDTVRRRVGLIK